MGGERFAWLALPPSTPGTPPSTAEELPRAQEGLGLHGALTALKAMKALKALKALKVEVMWPPAGGQAEAEEEEGAGAGGRGPHPPRDQCHQP